MRLEFINDRLMSLDFVPDNFSAYHDALRRELENIGAVEKEVPPGERVFVLKDGSRLLFEERYSLSDRVSVSVIRRDDVMTVHWSDLELVGWAISL